MVILGAVYVRNTTGKLVRLRPRIAVWVLRRRGPWTAPIVNLKRARLRLGFKVVLEGLKLRQDFFVKRTEALGRRGIYALGKGLRVRTLLGVDIGQPGSG